MTCWRKSSYSATDTNCVEVGRGVGIRDSKAPSVELPLTAHQWAPLLRLVRTHPAV
ncbi:DUF397 domain-containing protein [Lentzea flaviverrucosa]|jgi:hypothetical protein|uniref:DUF397 domain-containing protein n=1 Tax=Lentzea flaviverrucosa TaxID=200379 RepID=A0A1H9AUP1_9PSEU|nr:DUF397 domain-containing protein [Lentzea flaviverrucosa]RDI31965.1 uncharacterized protein DUF397 [Lentzea flaviverrucosa]SEP80255.1 protein of unknown function [Lentzea flaviverrucosa]